MTSILGDSYGLVANDSQRGAILTRFQETVNWLQTRCDKLVIVAHSQGTAVVHEAIQASLIPPPPLLVTFGSGLASCISFATRIELAVAAYRSRVDPADRFGRGLATRITMGQRRERRNLPAHSLYTLHVSCLGCIVGAWSGWRNTRVQPVPAQESPDDSHRWVDLYASHDPIPQGSLTGSATARHRHREDRHRCSALSDHVTYWKNKSEFVTRVVAELDKEATCWVSRI